MMKSNKNADLERITFEEAIWESLKVQIIVAMADQCKDSIIIKSLTVMADDIMGRKPFIVSPDVFADLIKFHINTSYN